MSEHTPGPWKIGRNIIGVRDETGFKRHIAAVLWDDEQGKADARLIAAAPDLLEALRALLWKPDGWVEQENARAAIAKATTA